MTKQTKIIIAIVAGILVLCLITCVAGILLFRNIGGRVAQSVDQDPASVETTAEEIVNLDLPAGFQAESSLDLLGLKMAMYENPSSDQSMVIMQIPTYADTSSLEQMQQLFQQNTGRNFSNMRTIEERELTVRGRPATMILQEGIEEESGEEIRQLFLVFEGQGGTAMISVFGPVGTWDQDAYERMIESIR